MLNIRQKIDEKNNEEFDLKYYLWDQSGLTQIEPDEIETDIIDRKIDDETSIFENDNLWVLTAPQKIDDAANDESNNCEEHQGNERPLEMKMKNFEKTVDENICFRCDEDQ